MLNNVTILILVEGSLQFKGEEEDLTVREQVTILILVEGSLQYSKQTFESEYEFVTILILVEGSLQLKI